MNWKIKLIFVLALLTGFSSCSNQETKDLLKNPYLIEVEDFDSFKEENNVLVIDIRKEEEFLKGHVPGAVNIWRSDITDTSYSYNGMMASRDSIQKLLGQLGASKDMKIITYDGKANCDATRLWWILYEYGHREVYILNGGMKEWEISGNKISKEVFAPIKINYEFPETASLSHYISLQEFKEKYDAENVILIDTRTKEEFLGTKLKNGAYKAGRIPGSIWIDWCESTNFTGDQKFKSVTEVTKLFDDKGVTKDREILVYCQSGVRSANTTFVLTKLLGFENVRNFDGSWIEWSFNDLPIEKGVPIGWELKNETLAKIK